MIVNKSYIGILMLNIWGCFVLCSCADPFQKQKADLKPVEFYISVDGSNEHPGTFAKPFKTIQKAQQMIRKGLAGNKSKSYIVWIRGGEYFLNEPLEFTYQDSPVKDGFVTYRSWPNEPVMISGSRQIKGFKRVKGNLWKTFIPDIFEGKWYFRQLFANGKRLTRSRWPNVNEDYLDIQEVNQPDAWQVEQTMTFKQEIPFENLAQKDAEVIFLNYWSSTRKLIRFNDKQSVTTEFPSGWRGSGACEPGISSRAYLENAFEFIDESGEWYLDRDTGLLYIYFADDKDPEDIRITAPVTQKLLILQGKSEQQIRNIHFYGLTFTHSAWQLPLVGYNGTQAGCYGGAYMRDPTYMLPPAIYLEYAENCSLERCIVKNCGTTAIALGAGCHKNQVIGCEISDIGGNGIVVGWRDRADEAPRRFFENDWKNKNDTPTGNIISQNHIHSCGQIQYGTVGYFELFSAETVFSHNRIHNLPYSGINLGFIWNDVPTSQRASRIEFNHIYDVMKLMYDGGGIYTLGYQPETVIRNNLIEDIHQGHGIYTDWSSSRILIEKNIINRPGIYGFQHHYGHSNIFKNNIIISPGLYAINHIREEAKPSFVFEKNIVWLDRHNVLEHPWYKSSPGDTGEALRQSQVKNLSKMDHNIYWDTRDQDIRFAGMHFNQWQTEYGQDLHSYIVDPKFQDILKGKFGFKKDSPALKLIGFQPINVDEIGIHENYKH